MLSFLTAIYSEFAGNSALKTAVAYTTARPGFYLGHAPDNVLDGGPFIVVNLISDVHERMFDSKVLEVTRVQFTLYSGAASPASAGSDHAILQVLGDLWSCFDEVTLTFAGSDYTQVGLYRDTGIGPMFDDTTDRWMYTQDYRVTIQKL